MIRVINLIDDTQVGGVMRGVADTARCLGDDFDVRIQALPTKCRLPPRMDADIIVIDFTLSWAKLPFLRALRLLFPGAVVIAEHSYTEAFERQCVPVRWRFRLMLRLAYRLAHVVVAVSDGQAKWMRDAGLVAKSRLVSIPQSLDLSTLDTMPIPPTAPGPMRLGAYGRFVRQKGFDLLIDAMRLVPPDVATLEMAGYGADEACLQASAASTPNVRIGGKLDGPAAFLNAVEAIVVPSRWEAYGLVAQEARAAGRPLIACSVDGLVEQLDDAWGLLVPPNDPKALAAAIIRLAGMDRHSMGQAARISAANSFDNKILAWRAVLCGLSGTHPAPAC